MPSLYAPFGSFGEYMLTILSPLFVTLGLYSVYLYRAYRAPPCLKKWALAYVAFLKALPGLDYDALDLFEALGITTLEALAADEAGELSAILQLDVGIVEVWIQLARKSLGLLPNKRELVDLSSDLFVTVDENTMISSVLNMPF